MNPKTFTLLNAFLSHTAYWLVAGLLGILCLLWFCLAFHELQKTIRLLTRPGARPSGRFNALIGYRLFPPPEYPALVCPHCHTIHFPGQNPSVELPCNCYNRFSHQLTTNQNDR